MAFLCALMPFLCGGDAPPQTLPQGGFGAVYVEIVEPVAADNTAERVGIDGQDCTFDGQGPVQALPARHQLTHEDIDDDVLALLARKQLRIVLAVQAHRLGTEAMAPIWALVERAHEHDIQVDPWLVLGFCDGYFPGSTNAELYVEAARELVDAWHARFGPAALVVDMELRWERTTELMAADNLIDSAVLLARMITWKHPLEYALASLRYAALVNELHRRGWQAHLSTPGILLDDYADGDRGFQQSFGVVIDGVDWDVVGFQLYRSLFAQQSPGLDAHFVYDYAKRARALFPARNVAVGIGLTHGGPIFPRGASLPDPAALIADADAAAAAGIPREHIGVYNLMGLLHGAPGCPTDDACDENELVYPSDHDPNAWLTPGSEHPQPPASNPATATLRAITGAIDLIL